MRTVAQVVALLVMVACGDPPPSDYPTQQVHLQDTRLGAGDEFEVRVFQQEKMGGKFVVSPEGSISFPLIGSVLVSGRTPAEIEDEIRGRLADGFLVSPQVSVLVSEYKSKKVSVLGQVLKSGTLPYRDGMTIIEAVSEAGGFSPMAKKNAVTVSRLVDGEETKYTIPAQTISTGNAPMFYVRPGDVILVPKRFL